MKILVLYRELAGYILDCISFLSESSHASVSIVAYPVNEEAPFSLKTSSKITLIDRNTLNKKQLIQLVKEGGFNLVLCGGWSDKGYVEALAHRKCPSVLAFDNHWTGTARQYAGVLAYRLFMRQSFDYAFVPGISQQRFARRLGFPLKKIYTGFYSCDVIGLQKISPAYSPTDGQVKRRLIYTGRYIPQKYSQVLFDTFLSLPDNLLTHWELHAYGTGAEWEKRPMHPSIVHHGFMQPEQLRREMALGNAFVLPSTFEPWGVVVHEFAAAGFPMLLSDSVGAAEAFLESGRNGFLFKSGDPEALKAGLIKLLSCSDMQLMQMGQHSVKLAQKINPETWSQTLLQIAREGLH